MESRIGLIGFGEAGRIFAVAGNWASSAHVFDIKTDSEIDGPAMCARYAGTVERQRAIGMLRLRDPAPGLDNKLLQLNDRKAQAA